MAYIRTVMGDISPDKLGITYSHEHIFCKPPYWKERNEEDFLLDDFDKSCNEVELFRKAGGCSIVDATVVDYGRCIREVAEISRKTGVNIVATTGFNKSFLWPAKVPGQKYTFSEWIDRSSIDELSQYMIDQVENGLDGTSFKAGQIKYGTGYNSITKLEEKTIRAAVRAHKATGAPVHAHLESGTMALEQIEILKDEGFDLHNISFGHMDRNPDPYVHRKVAETGAYICFDGIGKIKYHTEEEIIKLIFELCRNGYQNQILVSGDTARRSYYYSYSEAQGLTYILSRWMPRVMEEAEKEGLDGKQILEDLFINNPKRCFTFK